MEIEHRSPTISEYKKLRSSVGWWPTDEKAIEVALDKSLFSVVATEKNNTVGIGRIVGDGGLYYYIQDLIVHPELQKNGIGKQLMEELMSFIKSNAKPGSFIGLMSAKGMSKYYESYGFKARDADGPGMFKVIK
ncbi:MAG: GNAT family N-acetyltransferase [Desulfobacterales bacterium]|nr:GNAT family N-acetyltransferase [Desulfobacterales bacterium]